MAKILIVDDDQAICASLNFALEDQNDVYTAAGLSEALSLTEKQEIDIALVDLRLGEDNGLDLLKQLVRSDENLIVIMMTAYGSIRSSVECMKEGAFHYITKPIDLEELKVLIHKGLEYRRLSARVEYLNQEINRRYTFEAIIGRTGRMCEVEQYINKVKDINSNVLIEGESGTGKELVARAIHYQGRRRAGPFQVVNCAAIPRDLLESELFGHERGAFTGADKRKKGRFEMADGGTIFLDEIGEMDFNLQAKILRVLQDKEVTPVGSTKGEKVDVRIIAATNKDLEAAAARGAFREDLYYRLKVITIRIPPLRERREDIPLLVEHFINKICSNMGKKITGIEKEAMERLKTLQFKGNVRELENMIERAIVLAQTENIGTADLFPEEKDFRIVPDGGSILIRVGESMSDIERRAIITTWEKMGRNQKKTAEVLGISERSLRDKLKSYQKKDYGRK